MSQPSNPMEEIHRAANSTSSVKQSARSSAHAKAAPDRRPCGDWRRNWRRGRRQSLSGGQTIAWMLTWTLGGRLHGVERRLAKAIDPTCYFLSRASCSNLRALLAPVRIFSDASSGVWPKSRCPLVAERRCRSCAFWPGPGWCRTSPIRPHLSALAVQLLTPHLWG